MKTKVILICIIALTAILSSCKKDPENQAKDIDLTAKQKEIVIAGNGFSLGLLQKIDSIEADNNYMISPLSIDYALAMTANGAKNNTLDQMLNSMEFAGFELAEFNGYFGYIMDEIVNLDEDVNLSIANSIWYRNGFTVLPEFISVNQDYYDAEVSAIDFDAANAPDIINNWVSDATNGKIPDIIDNIGNNVVMYLINAVYFFGTWKYEFDQSETQKQDFYVSESLTTEVDMMKMEAELKYYSDADLSMVEIPYGHGNFVMDVILPAGDNSTGDVISNLNNEKWQELCIGLVARNSILSLPKFKFDFENNLVPPLQALGMTDMFIDGLADFSGINGTGGLYVSAIKHKTYIDVNEEGTEAAAVTSVEMAVTSVNPDSPLYITVNRPFVFVIRELSTGVILFTGVVNNPVE
jgi:serpin B